MKRKFRMTARVVSRVQRKRWLNLESLESRRLLVADHIISEFLASNDDGLIDDNGNHSDWIEIYNAGIPKSIWAVIR